MMTSAQRAKVIAGMISDPAKLRRQIEARAKVEAPKMTAAQREAAWGIVGPTLGLEVPSVAPARLAAETVPVIHEANDAGPYATVDRDTKELAKGQALGKTATPRAIYDLLHAQLAKESQEVFLVIPLNLYGKPISRPVEIARGQRDRVTVSIEDILRPVIATNAKGFVVVHNHPGLRAKPSPKDRELTASIKKAAKDYSFTFLDHVIIATNGKHGEYYSFTEDELHTVQ